MTAILIVTVVSAIVSFCCSLMEACLYSIPPSKIEEMRRAGHPAGERLARLRRSIDEPISAILTLNTVANTVGAALAGALVGKQYGSAWVGAYSAIFTLIILFFSEIIPKTLGVTYADRLAPAFSTPIAWMIRALYPFVKACRMLTSWIRTRGGKGVGAADGPSEQEILALAEMGARAGTLMREEARWAANALRLNDVKAAELMTPRTVVDYLPADLTLAEVAARAGQWRHSRVPIVRNNNPDEVAGIVYRREVFDRLAGISPEDAARLTLRDFSRPALIVPETIGCDELLKRFLGERRHLAIVTNEYGGMEGVIALEDIIEFILGEEIVDHFDEHADLQEVARRKARRRLAQARIRLDRPE